MKRGADVCKQALAPFSASDTKEPIEEHFQLFNNRLLFRGTVSAAETRNRRHQIVDVRAGRFDNAVTEGMGDKVAGFRIFQVFFLDEGGKLFLFSSATKVRHSSSTSDVSLMPAMKVSISAFLLRSSGLASTAF